jgi:thiamine transport system permease protein
LQVSLILLAGFGFFLPLAAILAGGTTPEAFGILASPAFLAALLTSVAIATASAALAIALALVLGLARANVALTGGGTGLRLAINAPAFAYLATPAVVLSLGFFLLARGAGISPALAAPPVIVLANALLALPLAAAIVGPPLERLSARTAKLQRSLALSGLTRFREIELPLIRADLGYAAAVAFCLSFGDLGVIALFGTADFATLPWLMYRAMGAYRTADAAVIAASLFALTLVAFLIIPKLIGGGRHADA